MLVIKKGYLVVANNPLTGADLIGKVLEIRNENIFIETYDGEILCLLHGDIVSATPDS